MKFRGGSCSRCARAAGRGGSRFSHQKTVTVMTTVARKMAEELKSPVRRAASTSFIVARGLALGAWVAAGELEGGLNVCLGPERGGQIEEWTEGIGGEMDRLIASLDAGRGVRAAGGDGHTSRGARAAWVSAIRANAMTGVACSYLPQPNPQTPPTIVQPRHFGCIRAIRRLALIWLRRDSVGCPRSVRGVCPLLCRLRLGYGNTHS